MLMQYLTIGLQKKRIECAIMIKAAEAERQKKREGDTQQSSFSTDDFYEAALLRSYKENK